MKYILVNATNNDIDYLKKAKLYNIFNYAHNLSEKEINQINKYVNKYIPMEIKDYKIIMFEDKTIGCYLVVKKDDGVILDEIYLDEKYRNKEIGSNIIKEILANNKIVYLWVYKENEKAISLYKKIGFNVKEETDTRYYMMYKE